MNYISIAEAAEKWGITRRHVHVLCAPPRINEVQKIMGDSKECGEAVGCEKD